MRKINLIARRELFSIICSPAGLITLAIYLVLAGYLFSFELAASQEATLRYLFSTLGTMTIAAVPLITMRLLSEELRSGTFEVLTTHPVTDVEIVLGKFLAGWAAFAVLSFPTLSYLVILQVVGSPDWGPALCGFLGQQLMAAMLIALGLLVSAMTSSQVLAAMGAMIGGGLLALSGVATYNIQGWQGDALSYLAILQHFSLFRRGVVDSRAVIFFVGTTVMFLYLAVRAVESRRWKFGVLPVSIRQKWMAPRMSLALLFVSVVLLVAIFISRVTGGMWSLFHFVTGVVSAGIVVLVLLMNWKPLRYRMAMRRAGVALVVVANTVIVLMIWGLTIFVTSRHYMRLDTTSAKHYALSPQTLGLLKELAVQVDVYAAMPPATDFRQEIEDLLAEYKAVSSHISVQLINPVEKPGDMERIRERYKLTSPLSNEVLVGIGDKYRRMPVASFVKVPVLGKEVLMSRAQFVGEAEMTSCLIQLTRKTPGHVAFLSGHGEKNPADTTSGGASTLAAELRRNGWIVSSHVVTPGEHGGFSDDTPVVIVAGPQKELSNEDTQALENMLNRGGGVLFLIDPGINAGLETMLNSWNVRFSDDLVIDLQNHLASADPTSLYVTRFVQDHPIGKGMGSLAAVLPTARRISMNNAARNPNIAAMNFIFTSGNSWAVIRKPGETKLRIDRNTDKRGPLSLGIACERYQQFSEPGKSPLVGRIVVIGDSDFINNQYVDMSGNMNLALNSVDWLAGRHELISVRPKTVDARFMSLTRGQTQAIFWVSVLVVPLLSVLTGVAVIRRRKKQA